jgi:hypothetical protein
MNKKIGISTLENLEAQGVYINFHHEFYKDGSNLNFQIVFKRNEKLIGTGLYNDCHEFGNSKETTIAAMKLALWYLDKPERIDLIDSGFDNEKYIEYRKELREFLETLYIEECIGKETTVDYRRDLRMSLPWRRYRDDQVFTIVRKLQSGLYLLRDTEGKAYPLGKSNINYFKSGKLELENKNIEYAVYEKEPAHQNIPNGIILSPFKSREEAEETRKKYGHRGDNYFVDKMKS